MLQMDKYTAEKTSVTTVSNVNKAIGVYKPLTVLAAKEE